MSSAGRWLIITTGANQRFIFGSNKRRLNVGASHLVTRLSDWLRDAIAEHSGEVEPVVLVSGVAELLVTDPQVAREVVEGVTRRALEDAPGLEIWATLEPASARPSKSMAERLTDTLRWHEQRRQLLTPVAARNPGNPFSERCAVTDAPAVHTGKPVRFGDEAVDLAPTAYAQARHAGAGLETIAGLLRGVEPGTGQAGRALLSLENLDRDVSNNGWVAVVHADGNGFGRIFADLGAGSGDAEYLERLSTLSDALEAVARASLRLAVDEVAAANPKASEWILPLIVGGDDLTAIVDARLARSFTELYLRAFEDGTAADPVVSGIAARVTDTDHLTACAGIAIVKPSHPFNQAYQLAEDLCRSAKQVKSMACRPVSAYDVQVVHEASGRTLVDVRAAGATGMNAGEQQDLAGPYVVASLRSGAGGTSPANEWMGRHGADLLQRAVDGLATGALTSSAAHDLRSALVEGGTALERRRATLVARHRLAADAEVRSRAAELEAWLTAHVGARGLVAMDLLDVEGGPQ